MKGPGLRLTLTVERRWSCPACGRKVITDGDVTALSCACTDPPQWMKMADPKTNPRPVPRMPDAQTLTDEDLDRLGIEALKEPVSEQVMVDETTQAPTAAESPSDETAPNLGSSSAVSDESPRTTSSAEPPSTSPTESPLPAATDEFGAGLDE